MQTAQIESITAFTASRSRARRDRDADNSEPLPLWELRRGDHELLCATVFTRFGCALALALSGELIAFELEPTVERLVDRAERLETGLLAHGWTCLKR